MGVAYVQYSSALEPHQLRHMSIFGHMSQSQRVQCIGALDVSDARFKLLTSLT